MNTKLSGQPQSTRDQHQNLIRIDTILGKDALFAYSLSAQLGMSTLDHFSIDAYSDTHHNIQPTDIIGTPLSLKIIDDDGSQIPYHAYVFNFHKKSPALTGEGTEYSIQLKPWLGFLAHESDCRIFQNVTVSEALKKILQPYSQFGEYRVNLQRNYPIKRYLVQYNETNLNFFHRLCHYHEIAYYFSYEEGKHHLHIIDNAMPLFSLTPEVVKYQPSTRANDHLVSWERKSRFVTGNREHRSYNYKSPAKILTDKKTVKGDLAKTPQVNNTSHYAFIEDFLSRKDFSDHTQRQLTETVERDHVVNASGDCRFFKIAHKFSAEPVPNTSYFPDKGKTFTLINLCINAINGTNLKKKTTCNKDEHDTFHASITATPHGSLTYPDEFTRVNIHSLQTAVVTGPAGEEIFTDTEGRIKVQFHWDRQGKKDENTTCWMRVMQSFAGPGFGAQFTPRIGQEVVIAFENGNPDRPFVTGALYHPAHLPPYAKHQGTRNGIRTRSTKGATPNNFNEIRFEDKLGSEQLFFHAEKDQDIIIKNDRREHILHDRHKTVEQDQYEITKRDHHTIVGKDRLEEVQNSSFLRVARDYVMTIGQNVMRIVSGGEMHRIMGSRTRQVMGSEGIEVKKSRSVKVGDELFHKGPNMVYQGEKELTIKGPGGFIKIDNSGVTIVGKKVKINEGGSAGVAEQVPTSTPNEAEKPRVADQAING